MKRFMRVGRAKSVRIGALVSAFLLMTSLVVAAFADEPMDYLKESLIPPGTLSPNPELPAPLETVKIDVSAPAGSSRVTKSETLLRAGTSYRLVVKGVWTWFKPNNFADGECAQWQLATSNPDPTWLRNRFAGQWASVVTGGTGNAALDPAADPLDVYVDGAPVEWTPLIDTGGGCNTQDHTYYVDYTPQTDRRVSLQAFDPFNRNVKSCVATSAGTCIAASDRFVVTIHNGPQPEIRPGDQLVESVIVDPRSTKKPPEVRTTTELEKGESYRFIASGTYSVSNFPGYVGDAECGMTDAPGDRWEPERFNDATRFPDLYTGSDTGDIVINGETVTWVPLWQTSPKCNGFDHKYSYLFKPNTTAKSRFMLLADHSTNNGGLIRIDIYKATSTPGVPQPEGVDLPGLPAGGGNNPSRPSVPVCTTDSAGFAIVPCHIEVPAKSKAGTSISLRGNTTYRLDASGTYSWHSVPGNLADAECSQWTIHPSAQDPLWLQNRFGVASAAFSSASWTPSDDPLDLYVDNASVAWAPQSDSAGCDTTNHVYSIDYKLVANKLVNFRVFDPMAQNALATGSMFVTVSSSATEPEAGPNDTLVSVVVLSPKYNTTGQTELELPRGRLHRIVATGTYKVGDYELDAECASKASSAWNPYFWGSTTDLGDVIVDNQQVSWVPLKDNGAGCNTIDHAYRILMTPTKTGRVTFKLRISDYSATYEGQVVIKVYAVG